MLALEKQSAGADVLSLITDAWRVALVALGIGLVAMTPAGARAQGVGALGSPAAETAPPDEERGREQAGRDQSAPAEPPAVDATREDAPAAGIPAAEAGDAEPRIPEPPSTETAPSRSLDAPVAPVMAPRDAAQQLANLAIEEHALAREDSAIDADRAIAIALYVGGIGLTVASVAMLVASVLQAACVSEEFGCYDAPQYIIGGVPVALVGALVLSGAGTTDARIGMRARAVTARRDVLEEQRRRLERRVGLAIGPGSVRLSVSF